MHDITEYDFECEMLVADVVDIFDRAYFWENVTVSAELEMAH